MTRLSSPACLRNREPLLSALRAVLPAQAHVLEVACGTGEHAAHFAAHVPSWTWTPTDLDERNLASAGAWCEGLANVQKPVFLDVRTDTWAKPVDAVFCANMVHIAPWEAAVGLLRVAARCLRPGGLLITYGPYKVGGQHTAPSNAQFDQNLKLQDPSYGVRDREALIDAAVAAGLSFREALQMPANNQVLVFERR